MGITANGLANVVVITGYIGGFVIVGLVTYAADYVCTCWAGLQSGDIFTHIVILLNIDKPTNTCLNILFILYNNQWSIS